MQVHVLGSAAGGGVPQWNCACSNCAAARDNRLPHRTQASIAASADGETWVLFNASTDVRAQIERDSALTPRGVRRSPIAAVVLTDANIDHAAGLLDFRQAGSLNVYSSGAVRATLLDNPMFEPFSRSPRAWETTDGVETAIAGLRVTPVAVPGSLPAYAGGARVDGAMTAYSIEDGKGARVLYAPVFAEVCVELARAARDADAVFLDGSFWTDDELISAGLGTRTAREMGHAPIAGDGGSLSIFAGVRTQHKYYTHINNSNPALDPASAQAATLRAAGVRIAEDGAVFRLHPSQAKANADA
jgi:pyrroloquinoline quinone biosynthesis protein B